MIIDHHPLYPVTAPREERMLKVSDIHTLHYAVYGNPNGTPVVVLHAGPGAGCDDSQTKFFDLNKWNVVMFDQRGAMKSTPFACMEENTPQHSISDIEMLRASRHRQMGRLRRIMGIDACASLRSGTSRQMFGIYAARHISWTRARLSASYLWNGKIISRGLCSIR